MRPAHSHKGPCIRTAIVIGGGVAGPVAALALKRAGIAATVYEASPSRADGIGGTLALAPNGLAALANVGADHLVRKIAQPLHRMTLSFGGKLVELPSLTDVEPLQVVHRAGLYRALHDRAAAEGIRIVHGKRLKDAHESANGVTAVFTDNTCAEADVLIGADGVHSTVRCLIDPASPGPRYTGLLGFEAVSDYVPAVDTDTMSFTFGKRAYYLYWREAGGGTRWGMNLPSPQPMTSAEARARAPEDWLANLRETYGEDEPGGALVSSMRPGTLQAVGGLHIMPAVPNWHAGRKVLVGDAVHAPSNSSGQGASLAIESAIELARCLRDCRDIATAFAAYEGLRRARVEGIAARAARINHAKAPGPIARLIMPALLRLMVRTVMRPEKTLGPEQRYRIDFDAPVSAAAR